RMLVVDADTRVRAWLTRRLRSVPYTVEDVGTGAEALDRIERHPPDLAILDLALPDIDDLVLLSRLREETQCPVIVLSVESAEEHKVQVLDGGADDYLIKPFGMGELLARVRVQLRHAAMLRGVERDSPALIDLGDLQIHLAQRRVLSQGTVVPLTPREWDLLRQLARNVDKVLTNRELLSGAWGSAFADDYASLRTYIKQLRKKLEPDPLQPRYILNEPGMGYRLRSLRETLPSAAGGRFFTHHGVG
ncbi:MAG: response regulator transcription factor, partial [Chloroflexota bacterium]|nr:response regulator transcription factor [Chloroflexota bacterium]